MRSIDQTLSPRRGILTICDGKNPHKLGDVSRLTDA